MPRRTQGYLSVSTPRVLSVSLVASDGVVLTAGGGKDIVHPGESVIVWTCLCGVKRDLKLTW